MSSGTPHRHPERSEGSRSRSPAAVGRRRRFSRVFELDGTVLRLEGYPLMDDLLEVEGEPAAIERVIAASGIARASA